MNITNDSQLVRFSLRIWGENLRSQAVSDALGIDPTYTYEKGYRKKLSSGKVAAPKELGIWVLERIVRQSVKEEMDLFLKSFPERKLTEIKGVQIALFDLYLGVSDLDSKVSNSYECTLTSGSLAKLVTMNCGIRITVS